MFSLLFSIVGDIGRSFLQLTKWMIILVIVVLIFFIVIVPVTLTLLGYRVNGSASETAKIAYERQDVTLCRKLFAYDLLGPPSGQRQASCISDYAALAKDPSVCQSLMPTSYGWDCVGGASESPICGINSGFEVQWHEEGKIQRSSLRDCVEKYGRTTKGDHCCLIAKVSGILGFNDCSSLAEEQPLMDNCLNELAFKNHDPATCAAIHDQNIKSGCEVITKALQKDPSICTGCTPPLKSIDELDGKKPPL